MAKKFFKSNAKALTQKLLEQGATLTEVANQLQIGVDTLRFISVEDRNISLKTASKLRQAFGDDVIRCEFVQDEEPAELKISIESQPERRQKVFGELRGVISQMKAWRTSLDAELDEQILAALDNALISVHKLAAHLVTDYARR